MTLDKQTAINPDSPASAYHRDPDSGRRIKDYLFEEGRSDREKNRDEHEELRLRVAAMEREIAENREVVMAAREMVAASKMVKSTIVVIAVIISIIGGLLTVLDRFGGPK